MTKSATVHMVSAFPDMPVCRKNGVAGRPYVLTVNEAEVTCQNCLLYLREASALSAPDGG